MGALKAVEGLGGPWRTASIGLGTRPAQDRTDGEGRPHLIHTDGECAGCRQATRKNGNTGKMAARRKRRRSAEEGNGATKR
ncbi:unnamed protein product [Boreogadus saida]